MEGLRKGSSVVTGELGSAADGGEEDLGEDLEARSELLGRFGTGCRMGGSAEGRLADGQFCSWKVTELFHMKARPQPGLEQA